MSKYKTQQKEKVHVKLWLRVHVSCLLTFIQAQADAEILKSVVMPLEEEIRSLKEQLHEARGRGREGQGSQTSPSNKHPTPDTQSLSEMDHSRDPEERVRLGHRLSNKFERGWGGGYFPCRIYVVQVHSFLNQHMIDVYVISIIL